MVWRFKKLESAPCYVFLNLFILAQMVVKINKIQSKTNLSQLVEKCSCWCCKW